MRFQIHVELLSFKRLATISSPMAKAVEAPAPLVTMAIRTPGSGAPINVWRSVAEA
jgi:hypothetical protein